jgi:hypothetical protein
MMRAGGAATPSNSDVAEAFSRHRFDESYPHMLDDIEWTLVGGAPLSGKADVMAACEESAEELASVRTAFEKFRVVSAADCVVIESQPSTSTPRACRPASARVTSMTSSTASCRGSRRTTSN